MVAVCILIGLAILFWPRKRPRRKRPECDLTPLEIRAFDTVDALDELDKAVEKLHEEKRTLPSEVNAHWVKARTASRYLRRFLEEGR